MPNKKNSDPKWYAVIKGKVPGIYTDWNTTKQQVDGFSGAKYKSFTTQHEANKYFIEYQDVVELSRPETEPEPPKIDLSNLSEMQKKATDLFKLGKNIFMTGPGGSGKSFLIKTMVEIAKQKQQNVQVCAMTGCAALLLNCGAKTIHSWGGIGLAKDENIIIATAIDLNSRKKRNWKKVDVLIVDEVSMMSKKLFELFDMIAKKVRRNQLPFGGIQVIFSGDFFQLPPVKSRHEEDIDTQAFCFETDLWDKTFESNCQIEFTEIFRQKDKTYAKILNQIRKGTISTNSLKILNERVGCHVSEELQLKPTILLPVKSMVERINNDELSKLTGDEIEFHLETCKEEEISLTEKEQYKLRSTPASVISKEKEILLKNVSCDTTLKFKQGSQVMCNVNLDLNSDLPICNGSLGIITRFTQDGIPVVKFNNGAERPVNKHIWKSENIPGVGVKQIPLVLAWAITIHKSQGATLDLAEIDVGSNIFEAGQTYVALSRVKELNGLFLKSFNPKNILVNKKVKKFYERLHEKQKFNNNNNNTSLNAFELMGFGLRNTADPVKLGSKPGTSSYPPSPETC